MRGTKILRGKKQMKRKKRCIVLKVTLRRKYRPL